MRAAIDQIPIEMEADGIVTRGIEWDEQLVRWVSLPAGVDFTPLFVGLPDDLCQCAHVGYVTAGSITIRYADGTMETCRAGDVYSWPAGHTGWTDEGVTFLEFSPAADLLPVLEHLGAQMTASA